MVNDKELTHLSGSVIYMVGIKGTGMSALAEILRAWGALILGSDSSESFYTDAVLKRLKIPFYEGFSKYHIRDDFSCVIHSAAYNPDSNEELIEARRRGIKILTYAQALGVLTERMSFSAVSGVHGKTTTTAITGILIKTLNLPATVLVGSEVPDFGGSSLMLGKEYFIAECDEYRRKFLNYHPERILITSIELDHPDYYHSLDDVLDAFKSFVMLLPAGGGLIYNSDDPGACQVAAWLADKREDVRFISYGTCATGKFRIHDIKTGVGQTSFSLQGYKKNFVIEIPGEHSVFNAVAALALTLDISNSDDPEIDILAQALQYFRGTRRRSEILGTAGGIVFMDDYAHHPTAVCKTLEGIKDFYSQKRIIVDFMPHMYSRTKALLDDFARCFQHADQVVLHKIYASAREKPLSDISGRDLYRAVRRFNPSTSYFEEPDDAIDHLKELLREGDLFITMGAGDNWKMGKKLFDILSVPKGPSQ